MEDNKKPEENKKQKQKRYYWLKLRKEFFKQKTIKKMRQIPGGEVYALIFLEMLTIATETEGIIYFEGVESSPEEELALVLDEDVNAVKMTVNMLRMLHLLEDSTNGDYFLPDAIKMTGSESESAERMRRSRQNRKNNEEKNLPSGTTDGSNLLNSGKNYNNNEANEKISDTVKISLFSEVEKEENDTDTDESLKVKNINKSSQEQGFRERQNKSASHCDSDVTKCDGIVAVRATVVDNVFTEKEPVDNSEQLSGMIPDNTGEKSESLKVKNTYKSSQEQGFRERQNKNASHCDSDVTKCDDHKEIELELEKEKVLTNHPTDYNHSSLKSAIDTNCNIIRANARAIEENRKPDDFIPNGTSLHQESPVTEVKTSMVGWMDDGKNNLKNENEIEPLFQKFMKEYPRPVKMQEPAKAVFRELVQEYGVDPYDLIEAAARYTKKVLEEKTMERFMTVPQNFLADLMWVKYIGPTRKRCPICHGAGYYDDGRGMAICKCTKRYSKIPKLDNHMR